MSKLIWLLGGTALALAVFAILNGPETLPVDGVEGAAGKIGGWGLKQRAAGAGGSVLGKVQEFAGDLTGDRDVSDRGVLNQAAGEARNVAGQAAEALGNTIHQLNKV